MACFSVEPLEPPPVCALEPIERPLSNIRFHSPETGKKRAFVVVQTQVSSVFVRRLTP